MLSIIVNARNLRQHTGTCVASLLESVNRLKMEQSVEFIFADDASDPGNEVIPEFLEARKRTKAPVRIFRFKTRQEYTGGLALTFSAAAGEAILFISHDMIVTPDYIRGLLAVAELDPSIGVVRGTSTYVDGFPHHCIVPATPPRNYPEVVRFAAHVAERNGLSWEEDRFLVGDSMLIKHNALERIGVFDTRYVGYFGDLDYGLRLQRAGLKLVCAKGAWLVHEGAAYHKHQAAGGDYAPGHEARMKLVREAYRVFRQKWDINLPPQYPGTNGIDFVRLGTVPEPTSGIYQPRLTLDPNIVEQL